MATGCRAMIAFPFEHPFFEADTMDLPARRPLVATLFPLLVTLTTGLVAAQNLGSDDPDGEVRTVTLHEPAATTRIFGPARSWSSGAGGLGSWQRGIAVDFLAAGIPPEGDLPTAAKFTPDGTTIVIAHSGTRKIDGGA